MKSRSKGAEERPAERARIEAWEKKVQAGYDRLQEKDEGGACEHWLEAWSVFLEVAQASDISSIREFDERFATDYLAFNWVQDLEPALWNAGLKDSRFFREGIRYANEYLQRFEEDDSLTSENMRRALASFHCRLGDMEKVDSLYGEWLSRDPAWGWGWIGWSDCYRFDAPETQLERAEALLQKGLAVPRVRDEADLLERLLDLYSDTGRKEEAEAVRARLEEARGRAPIVRPLDFDDHHEHDRIEPVRRGPKVGRNEPCPCGSGKKYKKCCGR